MSPLNGGTRRITREFPGPTDNRRPFFFAPGAYVWSPAKDV